MFYSIAAKDRTGLPINTYIDARKRLVACRDRTGCSGRPVCPSDRKTRTHLFFWSTLLKPYAPMAVGSYRKQVARCTQKACKRGCVTKERIVVLQQTGVWTSVGRLVEAPGRTLTLVGASNYRSPSGIVPTHGAVHAPYHTIASDKQISSLL